MSLSDNEIQHARARNTTSRTSSWDVVLRAQVEQDCAALEVGSGVKTRSLRVRVSFADASGLSETSGGQTQ